MAKDIIVVIGFIIALVFICKIFNLFMMKQYEKTKILKSNALKLTYGYYINNIEKLQLAGAGDDENGDYDVSKAIKKIQLSDDVRIKVDE